MPGQVTFKLTGFDKLEAALKQLPAKMARKDGGSALKFGANVIADLARSIVRVSDIDEPHIRDNIVVQLQRASNDAQRTCLIGFDKAVSYRAHFLEFGTSKMQARPFMRPAIEQGAEEAIRIVGQRLWDAVAAAAAESKG